MKKIIPALFLLASSVFANTGTKYPIDNPCIDCIYSPIYLGDEYLQSHQTNIFDDPYHLPLKAKIPYTIRCKFFLKDFNGSASIHVSWTGFDDQNITYIVNDDEFKQTYHSWEAYLTLTREYNVVYFKNVLKKQESDDRHPVIFSLGTFSNAAAYSCVALEEKH